MSTDSFYKNNKKVIWGVVAVLFLIATILAIYFIMKAAPVTSTDISEAKQASKDTSTASQQADAAAQQAAAAQVAAASQQAAASSALSTATNQQQAAAAAAASLAAAAQAAAAKKQADDAAAAQAAAAAASAKAISDQAKLIEAAQVQATAAAAAAAQQQQAAAAAAAAAKTQADVQAALQAAAAAKQKADAAAAQQAAIDAAARQAAQAAQQAAIDAAARQAAQELAQKAAQYAAEQAIINSSLYKFISNRCDINGFDLTSENVDYRTPEQLASRCLGMTNCNAFNIVGTRSYFKNIPDGSSCQDNPNIAFYSLKTKNVKYVPQPPPKTYLTDYNYNKCEIDGYDVRSESINGRSVEQIAKLCSETPNCNSFNWDGTTTYLKNVPNGARCINDANRNFYSLKTKNIVPGGPYLTDYNYNKCEIDGYDIRSESINGRSVEQIAKLCSETPNCNSFNWDGTTSYLKNVPDGSRCINGANNNFYSLKSKNINII